MRGTLQVQAQGVHGIAATAFPNASAAACQAFRSGGNAIDAAVAAAWALAVCEPSGSGLGGQTTMLIRSANGRMRVIDGHSHAPFDASLRAINAADQHAGYRAGVIPSTPATLDYARRYYGRLSNVRVLTPAINLADQGYYITPLQSRQLRWCRDALAADTAAASLFLDQGQPYQPGAMFRQPVLAKTLQHLANAGVEDFYCGSVAQDLIADMQEHDGLITEADLKYFALPIEREPLSMDYGDREVVSVPPPGGGAQLLFALEKMSALHMANVGDHDDWYCRLAEVILSTFKTREQRPQHPSTWSSKLFRDLMAAARHSGSGNAGLPNCKSDIRYAVDEVGETTHLCTADNEGNIVSLTQSIQSLFGAKVANARLGLLYNNYLTTCPRRKHPYQLGSHCLARSNAAPTLIIDRSGPGGRPSILAVGAAGSRRILTSILQVIRGVYDLQLSPEQALAMPRVHALLNGKVWIEKPAASDNVISRLQAQFKTVEMLRRYSYAMGAAQAIHVAADGTLSGGADPRRDGVVFST